jgi:ceramide glucosyltransferase
LTPSERVLLFLAAIPVIYYCIALFSSWRFLRASARRPTGNRPFTPAVSILKPVRGLDPDTYDNFASHCRQDYPEYELIFCTGSPNDPAVPVIEKLMADFPDRSIRLIYSDGHTAANDKVAKLRRLMEEARYEVLVMNDADVRVAPDYLRSIVAPLENENVGAVTCVYVSTKDTNLAERLQTVGMISDFYPGIFVAWQLDGVKFALGPTVVTTRTRIRNFGGFESLENRPADDLLVGRLVAEQGYEVVLLPYAVHVVPDFNSLRALWNKRTRWMTVMRHMRPWGHLGLIFTFGLPWSLVAVSLCPTAAIAAAYFGTYAAFRFAISYLVGVSGLKQSSTWKNMALVPLWDAIAFAVWVASFFRRSVLWRGVQYHIRDGKLVLATSPARRTL